MTIKLGSRVRATIEGTVRTIEDETGREYVSVEYRDIDGDLQRASYLPAGHVKPILGPGDTGTATELAEGLAEGSVINDNDHEEGDTQLYRWAYVGEDTWVALQNDYETVNSDDLEEYFGVGDHGVGEDGVFTVEYAA